ncbi:MAG: hypothetical protein MJ252_30665 [archaeon]|nr:hypothetical protein [archaeon]
MKSTSEKAQFIKGRNWGEVNITEKDLQFTGDDGKSWFTLPISSLANVSHPPGKEEIGLEFNMDEDSQNDFLLYEMHFLAPDVESEEENEVEEVESQKGNENKEEKDQNDENKGKEEAEKKEENEEVEGEEEMEEEKPRHADVLGEKLTKLVNIGNESNAIATLNHIQSITPRGTFDLFFMESFMKMHGLSHNYSIIYKNISKIFLVPKSDGHSHFFVIALKRPLIQGNTNYPFVVFVAKNDTEESVELNIPEKLSETIQLESPLEGEIKDILANLFTRVANIGVIVTSKTSTYSKGPFLKCSHKQNEGTLYPLEKCLLFLHKPVICIYLEDIKQVDLSRMDNTFRYFDLTIETKNSEICFNGFEKVELDPILRYFNNKKIKLNNLDTDENLSEERHTPKRRRSPVDEQPMELPSEEESLGDEDYEEGEDSGEEDEDEDMGGEEEEDAEYTEKKKKPKKEKK